MDVDLHACISGDQRAWRAFVERHAPVIYSAVRKVMGARQARLNEESVEDAVQDVFVRLIRDDFHLLRGFDPKRAALTTYLTLIARSVAIDHMRRCRRDALPLEEERLEPLGTGAAESGPEIPLHLLTDRQRLVLRMLFEHEMSTSDIARMLEVDEQTVRSTKHKALSRLRQHFLPESTSSGGG